MLHPGQRAGVARGVVCDSGLLEGGLWPSTGALRSEGAGEPAGSVAGCQGRGRGEGKGCGVENNKLLRGSEGSWSLIFNDK